MKSALLPHPPARPWRVGAALLLALTAAACTAPAPQATPASAPTSAPVASTAVQLSDVSMLAATCVNCHGPAGHAPGGIPPLYGASAERLTERMRDFKAGQAHDATVMTRLMKGYDDAQIVALAQWFSKGGKP